MTLKVGLECAEEVSVTEQRVMVASNPKVVSGADVWGAAHVAAVPATRQPADTAHLAGGPAGEPSRPSRVRLGPLSVCDLPRRDVVAAIVNGAVQTVGCRPWVAFALHVGGLNARADAEYVAAMTASDVCYADGISVVALARLAGGRRTERAPTTDIGWEVLDRLHVALGRPVRVALLGGVAGLAERAGVAVGARSGLEVVLREHGYHSEWDATLQDLRRAAPDVVLVGLGAPEEMKWVQRHRADLPRCLVMTCGGWFGFIAEDEPRAPSALQRAGLEWVHRLVQDPRRLSARYALGLLSTGVLAVSVVGERVYDRLLPGADGKAARPDRQPTPRSGAPTDYHQQ